MDFFFDCPSCNGSLVADDTCIGESTTCPHCSKWIQVPAPANVPAGQHPLPPEGIPSRMVIDSILVRELEDSRAKFRKLKLEIDEIKSTTAGINGSGEAKTVELEKQLAENAAVLVQIREQLATVTRERDELIAETSKVRMTVEANRDHLEKTKNSQDAALEKANRELVEIRTQLASLGMERGQIAAQLEQATKTFKTESEELLGERDRIATELERLNKALQTERGEFNKERSRLTEEIEHVKKALKSEREDSQKEKKKSEAMAGDAHRELDAFRKKIGLLESERSQWAGELADAKNALAASRDTLNNGQKTYAEALDKANKELVAFRAKIGEIETLRDCQAAELTEARRELSVRKKENEAAQKVSGATVDELKKRAEAAEKLAAKMQEECKILHSNIENGSNELSAKRLQLHKLRNEHQVILDTCERMKRELDAVRELPAQLSASRKERDSLAGELQRIKGQFEELGRRHDEFRKQSAEGQTANTKLQTDLKEAQAGLSLLQNKLKEMQEEQTKLTARALDSEKALQAAQTALSAAGKDQAETRQALEQVKKERENSARELSQANTVLARVQGQLDALKLNNSELRQANESAKAELLQNREIIAGWQGENDALEATLSNLESQLSIALKQIASQRVSTLLRTG